ncbi:MAG: NAD(P)/FAD-dependent oxidoreductase [Ilumatobacteraceae bacterium]
MTVVELAPQVLAPLDQDMVGPVHDELRLHGVGLALGRSVTEVRERTVLLDDGSELPAELVVFAIGVRPEIELATLAGLEIGPHRGIVVDDDLRTSVEGIYAVGDATEKRCRVLGEPTLIPLANLANRQGRRVADVIVGRPGASPPRTAPRS